MLTGELKGSRVVIRPLEREDMDILFNWEPYPDDETGYKFPQPSDIERGQEQTFARWTDPNHFIAGVICDEDRKIIGFTHFFRIKDRQATVGMAIRAGKLGMGYGSETLELWCSWGEQELGFRKINTEIRLENERSIWCFYRLGFMPVRFERRDYFGRRVVYAVMEKATV